MTKGTMLVVATLVVATIGRALAGAELILIDGRHLVGDSVRRRGGLLVLETDDGARLPIQEELVRAIRLTGAPPVLCKHWKSGFQRPELQLEPTEPRPNAERQASEPADDRYRAFPRKPFPETRPSGQQTSVEDGTRPSPDRYATPPSSLSPTQSEQLAAFGRDPATFEKGAVDPNWYYDDVLGRETDVTQFRPSRWPRSPIDPLWRYEDELGIGTDVTQFNPSTWRRSRRGMGWRPTDGWPRPEERLPDR